MHSYDDRNWYDALFSKKKVKEAPLEWWEEYRSTRDIGHRNRLINHYVSIVRYQAEKVAARLPASVELGDLLSAGVQGLMDALERYNPHERANFKTFSALRIRGAIIDSLRKDDWVPRQVRHKAKLIQEAHQELMAELQRNPTDRELANHLGLGIEDYESLVRSGAIPQVNSLNHSWQDEDKDNSVQAADIVSDNRCPAPSDRIQRNDLLEAFAQHLNKTEGLVISLYYTEDMTLREIGEILNLSESRVCQIHSRVLKRLRARFGKYAKDLIS